MRSSVVAVAQANPYPGLRPYDVNEFESFFGRDRQIDELLVRLRDHRFVAVVGLSGSGKSSLVRAGLIHKLQVGHLTSAGSRWRVIVFRPGSRPIEALAAALDDELGPMPQRAATLRQNTHELLRSTKEGREPEESLLLVVDQFEEIFRYQREKNLIAREAEHFVDLLLATEQDLSPDYRVYVVLTMRSDALGEAAQFEGLPETLNRCQYLVPRMTRDQLREAIEGPAALTDTEIAPDLMQSLLADACEGEDHLPLLQHLLMRLWMRRQSSVEGGWQITSTECHDLGGPARALNDHADHVLAQLQPPARQDVARRMFQQLTESGEGREQRRPTRLSRLAELTGEDLAEVTPIVEHFLQASFLTSPDRGTTRDWEVDITHECLIRQWTRLREWAKAEAADREEFRYFGARASRGGNLLTGTDLDLALRWLDKKHTAAWAERYGGGFLTTVEFIEASRAARDEAERRAAKEQAEREAAREAVEEHAAEERRREKKRRLAYVLVAGFLVAVLVVSGLTIYALQQRADADSQRARLLDLDRQFQLQKDVDESKFGERLAEQRAADAEAARAAMVGLNVKLEKERDTFARQVEINRWQNMVRESTAATSQQADDRAALLARQAFLFYAKTPDPSRRRMVEEALLKTSSARAASRAFVGHTSPVRSVAFHREGARLASGGGDNTIRVWSLDQTSASPTVLSGHTGSVNSVVFSPDGTRLASGSDDGTVRLWDPRQSTNPNAVPRGVRDASLKVLAGHADDVNSVAFSPDGMRLASGSDDNTIRLWDLSDPSRPDVPFIKLAGHTDDVYSVAFSPDGTHLVSASWDDTLRLWDLRQGEGADSVVFKGHTSDVNSVAFSPDGTRLASGSDDKTIRVWDPQEPNTPPIVLRGHQDYVYSVAFSPDGIRLASGSQDDTIRVWDLRQPDALPIIIEGNEGDMNAVAFSPRDGASLASGSDGNTIRVWDLSRANVPRSLYGHTALVMSVAFSRDGTRLASGGDDTTIRVWRLDQVNAAPVVLKGHGGRVSSVAFSPNDGRLASASDDDTVRIWDLSRPDAAPLVFKGHVADVNSVAYSPDGTRLASGSEDRTIRVWNLQQPNAAPLVLEGHSEVVNSVAFSPDGGRLASGSFDDTMRVWDLRRPNAPSLIFKGHRGDVNEVAFSPDGARLASASDDQTVRVWNSRRPDAPPDVLNGHQAIVSSVAFSPDDHTLLASGSWDDTIRLWDLSRPEALPVVIGGHRLDVSSVAFSPDGKRLASGSVDMTIRMHDLWTGAADLICKLVPRNLSVEEWRSYVGGGLDRQKTCADLPYPVTAAR